MRSRLSPVVRLWIPCLVIVALVCGAIYALLIRGRYYHPAARERSEIAGAWKTDGICVAVVWPPELDMSFVHGVRMALDELDARRTPLSGKIRLAVLDEGSDTDPREDSPEEAVSHKDVVAVIGHEYSSSAIPASVIYEQHGVIFIAANSTVPRLTSHGFRYVFRLTPDDRVIARSLSAFASERGFENVGVIYARGEVGEAASGAILSDLRDVGIRVPFVRSYMPRESQARPDFRPLVSELRREPLDAVIIADQLPRAADLILDLGRMGYTGPILGVDKLDSPDVWRFAGPSANNLYVASTVDPSATEPAYVAFRKRFLAKYGESPAYGASQGYDAMTLIINAILASQAADPVIVATTLRTREWPGLFGNYSFDDAGDVVGRMISIKRQENGQFHTVEQWREEAKP